MAVLEERLRAFEVALENISEGINVFDAEERLIFCNHRFLEIHRLDPDVLTIRLTLSGLVEHLVAANTAPMERNAYLSLVRSFNAKRELNTLTKELPDGRSLRIIHRPTP